ncbi:hypothetical protein Dimus_038997 [Dionaea muscipula]
MQTTVMNNHPRNPIKLESHNPKSRPSSLSTLGPKEKLNQSQESLIRKHYYYLSLKVTNFTSGNGQPKTKEIINQVISHHKSKSMSSSITTAETVNQNENTKQSSSHHNKETPITTPTTEYELSSPNPNRHTRCLIIRRQDIHNHRIRKSKSLSLKLPIIIDHQTRNPTQSSISHHKQAERTSDKQKTWVQGPQLNH